jgi:hypothetical protein
MEKTDNLMTRAVNRRSLLKTGALAGGAVAIGAGLMSSVPTAFGQTSGSLSKGDIAILQFLLVAELVETDLWAQYAELGGLTSGIPIEVNPTQTLNPYQVALSNLDTDGPQYITSNALDELTHANFISAYLESKGVAPVNLDEFRTLQGSTAFGAQNIGRLTNLMSLNVDTSWFVRYRSTTNPDFGATFPQAVKITNRPAIPRTDADFGGTNHIQVIANTAAFHFGAIEQGGTSLYQALAQKVSSVEVLKILLAIGGDETVHFLEWTDFAGNGVQAPVAPVSDSGLTFPNFFAPINPNEPASDFNPNNPLIQPSLIFPVPCEFISGNLPHVSVIRPTSDKFAGALAAVTGLAASNLFLGQSPAFFKAATELAEAADAAVR